MNLKSKLPSGGVTIFTVMSALASEHKAINLGQGFPDFDCEPLLKDRINFHLQNGKNQYCPMAGLYDLRQTLAQKIFKSYGKTINPNNEITITAGATQAIFTAISAFVHKDEEVIIIEPAYDSYKPSIILAGGVPISYSLKGPDFQVDWDEMKSLITPQTRMIIINTPQNPIGKTLKTKDLEALEQIVKDLNIIVLSDEVYEHLIYDDQEHQSILRYPKLYEQSLAVYSFGKTFHSTGWKIGYCIGPDHLMSEFRNVHQWNVFCVNSFVQYGLNDFLQDEATYTGLPHFYQAKRDYLGEMLKDSRLRPLTSEGTYFQLYDYSEISNESDVEFAKKMTVEYGVASIPVSVFYSEPIENKYIRLCFAKNEKTLEAAASLLMKHTK